MPPDRVTLAIPRTPRGIGNEIQHEGGNRSVEGACIERQILYVADLEADAGVGYLLAGVADESFRRIDPDYLLRRGHFEDRLAERPRSAANVEPAGTRGHVQPAQKVASDEPAPAADVWLVRRASRPDI